MNRTLVVTEDLPATAAALFLGLAPRTIALSGGATPAPVYERLAETPYPWEEVDVFFGDERCVPPAHADSNFRMAHESLLSKVPARAHRMPGESCDADAYEREIRGVLGERPVFDLVFLGLGEDGHTASLFPGDPALDERERLVVRVPKPALPPGHPRLTLTLPVLSAARAVVFLVDGASKRQPLGELLEGGFVPAARVAAERVVILSTPAAAPAS